MANGFIMVPGPTEGKYVIISPSVGKAMTHNAKYDIKSQSPAAVGACTNKGKLFPIISSRKLMMVP
jgi:hypothetical protein